MITAILIAAIWILFAIAVVTLCRAAVGGFDDDKPPQP